MKGFCIVFVALFAAVMFIASCSAQLPAKTVAQDLDPELKKEGDIAVTVVLFSRAECAGVEEIRRLGDMVVNRTDGKVSFQVVDIDMKRDLGRKYAVVTVPRILVFDKDGKLVMDRDAITENELVSKLKELGVELAPVPGAEGEMPPTPPVPPEQPKAPEGEATPPEQPKTPEDQPGEGEGK